MAAAIGQQAGSRIQAALGRTAGTVRVLPAFIADTCASTA